MIAACCATHSHKNGQKALDKIKKDNGMLPSDLVGESSRMPPDNYLADGRITTCCIPSWQTRVLLEKVSERSFEIQFR